MPLRMLIALAMLAVGCASGASAEVAPVTTAVSLRGDVPSACPLTVPSQPGFVPPGPYPPQPPPLYDAIWYGSAGLWTMLNVNGESWHELPRQGDALIQKTLWWREGYSAFDDPAPSISVSGRRLDGPAPRLQTDGPGTNGYREDIGAFMVVGLEIPTPGCWELTARHGDAELSYVVWVSG